MKLTVAGNNINVHINAYKFFKYLQGICYSSVIMFCYILYTYNYVVERETYTEVSKKGCIIT